MTINRIVAIDFGCLTAVACIITRETYNQLAPKDFYDCCKFIEVEPTLEGLDTFLKLADERTLFVGEPTGPYSGVWVDNLRCAGYQVRLIAHDILASFRTAGCGWRDKDDQHDKVSYIPLCELPILESEVHKAVAIGYYSWQHLDRPGAFNKIKTSHISEILELYLYKEKLNVRIGALTNQLRQMLHTEFPESLLKRSKGDQEKSAAPKDLGETKKGEAPALIKFVAGLSRADAIAKQIHEAISHLHRVSISWARK